MSKTNCLIVLHELEKHIIENKSDKRLSLSDKDRVRDHASA